MNCSGHEKPKIKQQTSNMTRECQSKMIHTVQTTLHKYYGQLKRGRVGGWGGGGVQFTHLTSSCISRLVSIKCGFISQLCTRNKNNGKNASIYFFVVFFFRCHCTKPVSNWSGSHCVRLVMFFFYGHSF